jgi:parallel beta-helix repeat protein
MLLLKGKMVSATVFTLLLASMFTVAFNVQSVRASGTIYIRADGSIDPPTAPIQRNGDLYTLTDNITNDAADAAIAVEKNDIVVDGAGFRVEGAGVARSYGIYLSGTSNVTIQNLNVTNFDYGIWLYYSSNNSISENNITDNSYGIWLGYSSDNRFYHNNFIFNSQQVNISVSGYANVWDDGYPSGGNYWIEYNFNNNATDLYSGQYQNESGSDGIGDIPYIIDANNIDDYPLMHFPFENHTIYSGPVYIRADGSVAPSAASILTLDNVTYTFTDNINGQIFVERDNIIIDGNGHTLQGPGLYHYPPPEAIIAYGMSFAGRENVTVQNTQITAFSYGIYLEYSSNINVVGNNVTNSHRAIILNSSSSNSVNGNSIAGQYIGIAVFSSSNDNIICGNSIADSYGYGIDVYSSSNVSVVGNNMTNDWFGIELEYSSDNSISGNNITNKDNSIVGINAYHSSNNAISGNCIANKNTGISIYYSSDNIIIGNNITANKDSGIGLGFSSNISIGGNDVTHNGAGIFFNSSSSNSICGNNITNNSYGIKLYSSSNNKLYHNNVIGNVQQAYIEQSGYPNVWDDGYPLGGNYWSDYNGTDFYSGPYQNETGSDGIGDVPYVINGDNKDSFPLVSMATLLRGDVNYDGIVDIYDAIILAGAFSSVPGSLNWNPTADINEDNIVDIYDAIMLAGHFNQHSP